MEGPGGSGGEEIRWQAGYAILAKIQKTNLPGVCTFLLVLREMALLLRSREFYFALPIDLGINNSLRGPVARCRKRVA